MYIAWPPKYFTIIVCKRWEIEVREVFNHLLLTHPFSWTTPSNIKLYLLLRSSEMIICAKKDLPTLVISTIWTNYSTYFILFLKKMIVFNPCHVMSLSHHKYHHRFLTFKMKAQFFEFHLTTQPCDDHALIKKNKTIVLHYFDELNCSLFS